jgi:hypothetical protein
MDARGMVIICWRYIYVSGNGIGMSGDFLRVWVELGRILIIYLWILYGSERGFGGLRVICGAIGDGS